MDMLSEEEKLRIKSEEIYREEIRRNLSSPKTRQQKILSFFNSSLGNWILTSILVGFATFSYNHFKDANERRKEKEQKIQKIDMEIQSRLYQYKALLDNMEKILKEPVDTTSSFSNLTKFGTSRVMQYFAQTGLYATWLRFKNGEQHELLSIQVPEYANRSINSLIGDEIEVISDKEEIGQLKSLKKYIISDDMFQSRDSRAMGIEIEEVRRLQKVLEDKLLITRWKEKD